MLQCKKAGVAGFDIAQCQLKLRSREEISVTFGRFWRDAMQGVRRSHSELWRRRATLQRACQCRSKCDSYF